MKAIIAAAMLALAANAASAQQAVVAEPDYASDARALEAIVAENYAYPERLPGGLAPRSARLDALRDGVRSRADLIAYAESVLLTLADHHAITGSSRKTSWALVPSYADLWITRSNGRYLIDAVRAGSPAQAGGVVAGDRLAAVDGVPIERAVEQFWSELGLAADSDERAGFAARVLAAGRRDRPRDLVVHSSSGRDHRLQLDNLYDAPRTGRPLLTLTRTARGATIAIHDSLGDDATIAAFDAAMAAILKGQAVEIDLTDTPSGGNTVVARAMMGWFVDTAKSYQLHNFPAEERRTGIARQWIEQVLPRAGKRHKGRVTVRVGRWTGSMGEGLAIGFDAIGARVVGGPMAGLLGAIYDFQLPSSGLVVKLPAERLYHIDGTPRERFVPGRARR